MAAATASISLRTAFLGQTVVTAQKEVTSRVQAATKKAAAKKAAAPADPELAKWYGADRRIYLPSGILDPADIPEYLTGEVAGEYVIDFSSRWCQLS